MVPPRAPSFAPLGLSQQEGSRRAKPGSAAEHPARPGRVASNRSGMGPVAQPVFKTGEVV